MRLIAQSSMTCYTFHQISLHFPYFLLFIYFLVTFLTFQLLYIYFLFTFFALHCTVALHTVALIALEVWRCTVPAVVVIHLVIVPCWLPWWHAKLAALLTLHNCRTALELITYSFIIIKFLSFSLSFDIKSLVLVVIFARNLRIYTQRELRGSVIRNNWIIATVSETVFWIAFGKIQRPNNRRLAYGAVRGLTPNTPCPRPRLSAFGECSEE